MEPNKHLQLNELHCDLIKNYMTFCKYQLNQRLKSIDYCFTSLLNCRVRSSETYTGDEVKNLLTDLQDVVRGEVDTELSDGVHTNVLFVQQLLSEAETWHLTLSGNVSELENREKLNAVKLFDEEQHGKKMSITVTQAKQIIPVEDMNIASALKNEVARLNADNQVLKAKIKNLEEDSTTDPLEINEKSEKIISLESQLSSAQEEIRGLNLKLKSSLINIQEEGHDDSLEKLQIVQQAVDTLSKELQVSKNMAEEQTEKLRKDLEAREDKLRQVQTNLLLAEKELDKKFQATAAYVNMKKIMTQKNSQIKNLRKKLAALGVNDSGDVENREEEDEDDENPLQQEEGFRI